MKNTLPKLKIVTVVLLGIGMAWATNIHQQEKTALSLTQGYYYLSASDPCHIGPICETFPGPLCTYGGYQLYGRQYPQSPDCNIRLYQPFN